MDNGTLFNDMGLDAVSSNPAEQNLVVFAEGVKSADLREIRQPKTVTYAQYRFGKLHNQMLIHIREELCAYLEKDFRQLNPKELIRVPLFCSHYPHFHGSPEAFMAGVKSFMSEKNVISFKWRFNAQQHTDLYRWMMMRSGESATRLPLPRDGAEFEQASLVIVNALRCADDPNVIFVDINPLLIPFLLYYGEGNGGTVFDRDVALRLTSSYSSRLYEYIMDWLTLGPVKTISLVELRSLLGLPSSYAPKEIKRRVLDVAVKEIENSGSDVIFSYEFSYRSEFGFVSGTRGRLPANCVTFNIKRIDGRSSKVAVKRMFVLLQEIADKEKQYLCKELAESIVRSGKEPFLFSKFKYYSEQMRHGQIKGPQYKNTMLKIVAETTGIILKSEAHQGNSMRAARRRKVSSADEPTLLFGE